MKKIFNAIAYIGIAVAQIIMFVVLFWLVYPYKTVEVVDNKIEVVNAPIKQGDPVIYKFKYCRYNDTPALISRSLEDGFIIDFPDIVGLSAQGCGDATVQTPNLPMGMPAGKYKLNINFTMEVNPIRTIYKHFESDIFYINE